MIACYIVMYPHDGRIFGKLLIRLYENQADTTLVEHKYEQ